MNWKWFILGIYGLIGFCRFLWAIRRKAKLTENVWAQHTIQNLSGIALFVTVLFETFLWPVELGIGFYLVIRERRKRRLAHQRERTR